MVVGMVQDIAEIAYWRTTTFQDKLSALLHHFITAGGYCRTLASHRIHYFCCLDGICETTTLFVCVLQLTKHKEVGSDVVNGAELMTVVGR